MTPPSPGDLADPWAAVTPTAERPTGPPTAVLAAAAVFLGAVGPTARLLQQGFYGRAAVVALLAVAWGLLVRRRPSGAWGLVLLGVVAAVASIATWSTIGRAPVLVAFAGVVVAHAALVRWAPVPGWPQRAVPVAGLAILPTALSQVTWFRTGSNVAVAALLVAGILVVESYHRFPQVLARWDRRFARGIVLLASAVGGLVLFVTVAVVLYLPGLLGRLADALRRGRRRGSYWTERSVDRGEVVRDASRPFATTEPRVRIARHLTGAVVLVALVGAIVVLVDDRRSAREEIAEIERADVFQRGQEVRFSDLAAYEGVDFADELKAEQDTFSNNYLVPSDVGGYDMADFSGRYTNVTDGVRRTVEPPACATCPRVTMWLIGGSAAFGLGQRDDHTIASELVRLAGADGISLDVVNLAVPGWTIHQEAQKVEARLQGPGARPDLVLFYNGYNDVVGTVMDSAVNGIRPDEPTVMDTEVIRRFTGEGFDPWDAGPPEVIGDLAARKYDRVRDGIGGGLVARRVGVMYAFQPDALASAEQYAEVEHVYEVGERVRAHFDRSLEVASTALSPVVMDLRHLLDDAPPVFADLVHTNEEGASRVADALYPRLADQLRFSRGRD